VSPQVVEVFGCSEQAFGEGAWRDAIAEEDLEGVIDHVRNEHAADRGAHVEYRIHHLATGEERWLTEQTTLVTVEGETLVQGLILDITTQVQVAKVLEDSENERRRLVGSLLRAAEAERVSLAAELHDDTVQVLAGALLTLDRIRADLGETDPTILGRIQRLRLLLAQAMERTRTLMFDINPQLLHASGLTAATRSLAAQLAAEGGFQATVEGEFGRTEGATWRARSPTTGSGSRPIRRSAVRMPACTSACARRSSGPASSTARLPSSALPAGAPPSGCGCRSLRPATDQARLRLIASAASCPLAIAVSE
jgi:PAS domain-containing protein/histidine kinase